MSNVRQLPVRSVEAEPKLFLLAVTEDELVDLLKAITPIRERVRGAAQDRLQILEHKIRVGMYDTGFLGGAA